MRRLLNFCLFLVLVGSVGYVLWKADLLPIEGWQSGPKLPPVQAKARDTLRISVADRPEKILVSTLHTLLKVKDQKLEVVPYNPETVWLELSAGEIDVVIAPLGEAVKAQGRFHAGRFLFTSGLSEGLDQLRALKEIKPKTVGVSARSGQELFALQNYPESKILVSEDHSALEGWLAEGAVESAVLQSAALSAELEKATVVLSKTSPEKPEPTVFVLSKVFEKGATEVDLSSRVEVLKQTFETWDGLVGYLETQPDLLRSNLRKAAEASNLDIDKVLSDYRFLTPGHGRAVLERDLSRGFLQQTLDLLVLAHVPNLTAPDWAKVVAIPASIQAAFPEAEFREPPQPSPTPRPSAPSPSPAPDRTPQVTPTPGATPSATPTASITPDRLRVRGSYHVKGSAPPDVWGKPDVKAVSKRYGDWVPALSLRQGLAVVSDDTVRAFSLKEGRNVFDYKADAKWAGPPATDGVDFFVTTKSQVLCLDPKGKVKWTYDLTGAPASELAVKRPLLMVASADASGSKGVVTCLDTRTGREKWTVSLPDPPVCPPTLAQGSQVIVVIADKGKKLRAWNAETGSVVWKASLSQTTGIRPSANMGRIGLCEVNGRVSLFDVNDGTKSWDTKVGSSLIAPVTISRDYVLVPAKDNYLYALSRSTGDLEWKVRLNSTLSQPAVVVGGRILQSDEDGRVHTADSEGNLITTESYGTGWLSRPVFSDRGWLLMDGNGKIKYYKR